MKNSSKCRLCFKTWRVSRYNDMFVTVINCLDDFRCTHQITFIYYNDKKQINGSCYQDISMIFYQLHTYCIIDAVFINVLALNCEHFVCSLSAFYCSTISFLTSILSDWTGKNDKEQRLNIFVDGLLCRKNWFSFHLRRQERKLCSSIKKINFE